MNIEIYKYFGILSLTTGWLAICLLLIKWGRDKSKSISLHAAAHKSTYLMMAGLETISLLSLIVFTVKWMSPVLMLTVVFSICSVLISIGLLFAAFVPSAKGIRSKLHDISAYGASLIMIPVCISLAASPNVSDLARLINYFAIIVMTIIFLLFLTTEFAKNNHLYLQCIYLLSFDLGLFAAAFIR